MQPLISNISSNFGIAVISLLFSSHANCPRTTPHSAENALIVNPLENRTEKWYNRDMSYSKDLRERAVS